MIAILLMVLGAVLALIGFLGLAALMIEPLYSMYMIIFKREDDYVYYETKPGKALLQRNKANLRGSCIFLLVVGVLCFGVGWFLKFGPRGTDSLFSAQVESGANKGDDQIQGLQNGKINADGNYVDGEGEEHREFVVVEGTTVRYRDEFSGTAEEFEDYLKQKDIRQTVYLIDKYAVSGTYHKVEALLEKYGLQIRQE
ncbi:MAG: hypothetical protein J5898_05770 [Lachnospiraceae bacterium]|nr:hypothetical protein [Lachnospiraceae bacterium]